MKAFKIDSGAKTITEIQIDNWREIKTHIGNGCGLFAVPVTFENNDGIYVDDEGVYHEFQGGFIMEDWIYPLIGNGVILGCDEEGESQDAQTSLEWLQENIKFVSKEEAMVQKEKSENGEGFIFINLN